ncbi:MAG TPA: hypothetical protein DEB59_02545 [Acidimicrobiaceae bacterium]|nr:hypothetical protein [Acidimicrobiaceae bacterium]HBU39319.1 hypothetical protein [Acidimicrobiaceae bacterium]|tara:strand:+ start:9674 stop:10489 length:816 start_codon:yes stop_codon:yes gene_type:complete
MTETSEMLTLTEAAERLDLHYMTVYKYVRSGKLPAKKSGGSWEVSAGDLDAMSELERAPSGRGHRSLGSKSDSFLQALLAGDTAGAWLIVQGGFDGGATVEEVICEVILPALRSIGDEWANGRLEVYEEHRASGVVSSLLGRMQGLPQRRGRKLGSVLIACPPLETHALPAAICAELVRSWGYDPVNLGADSPVDTIIQAAQYTDELLAIVLSTVSSTSCKLVVETVEAIQASIPEMPVIVGGNWPGLPVNAISIEGFPALLSHLEQLSGS